VTIERKPGLFAKGTRIQDQVHISELINKKKNRTDFNSATAYVFRGNVEYWEYMDHQFTIAVKIIPPVTVSHKKTLPTRMTQSGPNYINCYIVYRKK